MNSHAYHFQDFFNDSQVKSGLKVNQELLYSHLVHYLWAIDLHWIAVVEVVVTDSGAEAPIL